MIVGIVINILILVIELIVAINIVPNLIEFQYSNLPLIVIAYELIFFVVFAILTGIVGIVSIAFFHNVKKAQENSKRSDKIAIILGSISNVIAFIIINQFSILNINSYILCIILAIPLAIQEAVIDSEKIDKKLGFNKDNKNKNNYI